ncbi:MAG: ribonuclease T [Burkholderiales bacterium]|nr:ribonuclease T [Nitrosomonas sp.]MCP5275900.1 ribonuclease T [Burkholderiales bacterium]
MIKKIKFVTVFLVLFVLSNSLLASSPASGTFTATQSCEAFVSKNKRTNPGDVQLSIGQTYGIIEVNKVNDPSWYRLTVPDAQPHERWVAENCGQIDVKIGGGSSGNNKCNTAGLEDSYVLALSWQPAFCETSSGRSKPECQIDDKNAYQANNFALHGLWPNRQECGTKYGFCGEVKNNPGHFCDYPQLQLFTDVRKNLEQVMPSAAAGSCLQRHEWFKHGTCQTNLTIDEYFEVAVNMTRQFNASGIGYFMSRHIGETVTEAAFIARINCALGQDTHKSIELKCQGDNLVDVYIHLTDVPDNKADLETLMNRENRTFKSNCGGEFNVDPIGFAH